MDSKGLRLRSAVRIVEPRITSASMLTRVTVTPGKLPPLRGRSTTRKTTQGMKKRAATHRDSTRPVSGCGEGAAQKSTEQSPSPEPVHLPTLMGDSKASAAPPQVRQFGPSDTFTPERPAEPGESSATAGPPRVQQRSALSEPPCRTTGHTNATGSGAAADLNGQEAYAQKCGEVSPQGQRPAREMGSIEEDSTEATGKAEVSDETCDEIAADDGGQEGRAEEHVQHASLSEETRAGELNSKECLSAQAFSSEVLRPFLESISIRVDVDTHPCYDRKCTIGRPNSIHNNSVGAIIRNFSRSRTRWLVYSGSSHQRIRRLVYSGSSRYK